MRTPGLNTADTLRAQGESLAARLPPLLLAARKVAATVTQGVHGRRRVGPGDSFWQFRRHQAGDAADQIDWRQSARSMHLFVRETEWAAAQSAWLWRDPSASMAWHSEAHLPTKGERADLLLLALAALLLRAGERVALLGDGTIPMSGRAVLERLAATLLTAKAESGLPPEVDLPRHAQIVLIGDFLEPFETLERSLSDLAAKGVRGLLLRIEDPAEARFPYEGRMRFEGLEGEAPIPLDDAGDLGPAYRQRLAAHEAALTDLCRRLGWGLIRHTTDAPPTTALLALHQALAEDRRR
ncbi:MAG: DUF58 domain-containing protein [Rhodospirillales bacterium]|nr:DUF58 domain-containing protein [Rhodospirillales bacterium]